MACSFIEKVEQHRKDKNKYRDKNKDNILKPVMPFPLDKHGLGQRPQYWLKPFDEQCVEICKELNIAMENLPERFCMQCYIYTYIYICIHNINIIFHSIDMTLALQLFRSICSILLKKVYKINLHKVYYYYYYI